MENLNKFESDYLNRITSTVNKSEDELSAELKNTKITDVFYNKNEEQIIVENEKVVLKLGYEDTGISLDQIENNPVNSENAEHWRKLANYSIKSKRSGETTDLLSELPRGYEIFFDPHSLDSDASADVKGRSCIIRYDIAAVDGLLSLLHEIGHCIDYEQAENKKKWLKKGIADNARDEHDMEYILRRERGCWAYVLKKLKPLIKDGVVSREDVLLYADNAIYSHHSYLGEKIKEEEKKDLKKNFLKAINDFFAGLKM